jgi:selenide, water dikinase
MCSEETIREFTESMATLNKRASEIMVEAGVSTATDITGFGFLGHMCEVLSASKVSARVYSSRVPFFRDAIRLAEMKKVPGGSLANLKSFDSRVKWRQDIPETVKFLLNDAQTSGGLLIFVPKEKKDALVSALQNENILGAHVGDVYEAPAAEDFRIFVE